MVHTSRVKSDAILQCRIQLAKPDTRTGVRLSRSRLPEDRQLLGLGTLEHYRERRVRNKDGSSAGMQGSRSRLLTCQVISGARRRGARDAADAGLCVAAFSSICTSHPLPFCTFLVCSLNTSTVTTSILVCLHALTHCFSQHLRSLRPKQWPAARQAAAVQLEQCTRT